MPLTLVSGGQTGVDRAALDLALARGLACGGWVPKGRRAEDGPLDARYPVREAESPDYAVRTRLNVRDSDATLVLTAGPPSGGTRLTIHLAHRMGRPCRVVDLDRATVAGDTAAWLRQNKINVLNVAGPRESSIPGIYVRASNYLGRVLEIV